MRIALFILAGLAVAVAVFVLVSARTVFHEIEAVMTFGIAAVLFSGGAVCDVISAPRRLRLARQTRAQWEERERERRERLARRRVSEGAAGSDDNKEEPRPGWRQ
jgi:hypothetical protein